jgi:hypothetical protein
MFKLAAAVVDFYDDPEFTKTADLFGDALVPPDKTGTLRDIDFAVKIATGAGAHRKFPVYNKTATALSGRYYDRVAGELPEGIKKVAGYHLREAHLRFDLDLPRSLLMPFETVSGREVDFTAEAAPPGMYRGEEILKMAQEMFMNNFDRMDVLEKVARAQDLARAAQAENIPLDSRYVLDYVPKSTYGPLLEEALKQRETHVAGDGVLKEAFAKVLSEFAQMSPLEGPFLLYHFDKIAGLTEKYRSGLLDPFYAAWGALPFGKEAEQASEHNYKIETVARSGIIGQMFGENAQTEFGRDPAGTYDRWSKEHPDRKRLIDSLMAVIPTTKPEEAEKPVREQQDKIRKGETKPSERPAGGITVTHWGERLRDGL